MNGRERDAADRGVDLEDQDREKDPEDPDLASGKDLDLAKEGGQDQGIEGGHDPGIDVGQRGRDLETEIGSQDPKPQIRRSGVHLLRPQEN